MKSYRYQSKSELRVQATGWKIIAGVLAMGYVVILVNTYIFGGAL